MNKQAHILLIVCDFFAVWGLWLGYNAFQEIQSEIAAQAGTISYGNRIGFAIMGVAFPLFHLIALVGDLRKDFSKKYATIVNTGIYVLIALLIVAGAAGSYWVESHVENAGYVWCRGASGASAISRVLVYTKDMGICEELIEEDRRGSRSVPKKRASYPSQLQ